MTLTPMPRWLSRPCLALARARGRRRTGRLLLEQFLGQPILVLPDVFNPAVFRTSELLARQIPSAPAGATALELGCGSGAVAVTAARAGYRITALDINPEAVRCARINALLNHVEDRLDVLEGDLFEPVAGRQFDLVLFNPPFFRGTPELGRDQAWRAETVLDRFAAGLPEALAPGGQALVVFSSQGDVDGLLTALAVAGMDVDTLVEFDGTVELLRVYRVRHGST